MPNIIHEVELMIHRSSMFFLALATAILPLSANADTVPEQLTETLSVNGQRMPVERVEPTPLEGIFSVRLESGETFYSNASGSHFLVGDLYDNSGEGLVNLTEQSRNQARAAAIDEIPESERVVFRGTQPTRATVVVFTDPTCPYCTQLHEQVPELNERGIEIHYLAFPRSGMNGDAARTMQQIWCADNSGDALTRAKQGEALANASNCDNPVAAQYDLGMQLGVQGTPALILPDGQLVPGYVPPQRLAEMLNLDD
ncbi:DsbC family protein [Vreelandella rituensis]|uniref:Thiol:disulfide interchange protein n=1 Tax=Vreelandella rituensis TaxID=2282306 RepID=A0A368TUR9_9GAMM|nr:DsbC family protein [Halomonas rituensis]RCV88519.1 DsbC family protein [Halomonas rituensis]